jgi:dephospho-CoA kinase
MFIIGLTGGIGTGKTEICRILGELGAYVIDADRIVHESYRNNSKIRTAVVAEFGVGIVSSDGDIDRAQLGSIVFGDIHALRRINKVIHPLVLEELRARLHTIQCSGVEVVVVEVPLLVEAGWNSIFDEVWVTVVDEETAIRRTAERSGLSSKKIRARIRSQTDDEARLSIADAVIDNTADVSELEDRVRELWDNRVQ